MKPFYVKKLQEQNTCYCKYHIKMDELRVGCNNMWTMGKGIHDQVGYQCDCE